MYLSLLNTRPCRPATSVVPASDHPPTARCAASHSSSAELHQPTLFYPATGGTDAECPAVGP